MIPQRFVTEYPSRCVELFNLMEPLARQKDLIGSFSLIVATSVFLIPYERLKAAHPLNSSSGGEELYAAIRRVEKQRFLASEIWREHLPQSWRMSRIMNRVEFTSDWLDKNSLHPMSRDAENVIGSKKVSDVIRVIRNALAHGNVVYLDENGYEKRGAKVQYLAFLSRYEETEELRKESETYRLVATTEDGFLDFVKAWAEWLAKLPADVSFSQAAE